MYRIICGTNASHAIHEAAVPMAHSMQQYRIHAQITAVPMAQICDSTQYIICEATMPQHKINGGTQHATRSRPIMLKFLPIMLLSRA